MSVNSNDYIFKYGMKENEVKQIARQKGADRNVLTKITVFFQSDEDKIVTNENESVILEGFLTGKVKMPFRNFNIPFSAYKCEEKNSDGSVSVDILYTINGKNAYNHSHTRYYKPNPNETISVVYEDKNLDGVPDKGTLREYHYKDIVDEDGNKCTLDMKTGEKIHFMENW